MKSLSLVLMLTALAANQIIMSLGMYAMYLKIY